MLVDLDIVQKMLDWMRKKLYLETIVPNARKRFVKRGQVYRCDFGRGIGSEMQKERPAIIIQNDVGNQHSGNTIVIPVTHNARVSPCIVPLSDYTNEDGVIILDGQANASNIMCISKARLGNMITTLSNEEMKKIDEAIAKSLGIMTRYAELKKKYDDKIEYISRIKLERNEAQDIIKELRSILKLNETDRIDEYVKSLIDSGSRIG